MKKFTPIILGDRKPITKEENKFVFKVIYIVQQEDKIIECINNLKKCMDKKSLKALLEYRIKEL